MKSLRAVFEWLAKGLLVWLCMFFEGRFRCYFEWQDANLTPNSKLSDRSTPPPIYWARREGCRERRGSKAQQELHSFTILLRASVFHAVVVYGFIYLKELHAAPESCTLTRKDYLNLSQKTSFVRMRPAVFLKLHCKNLVIKCLFLMPRVNCKASRGFTC